MDQKTNVQSFVKIYKRWKRKSKKEERLEVGNNNGQLRIANALVHAKPHVGWVGEQLYSTFWPNPQVFPTGGNISNRPGNSEAESQKGLET